MVANPVNIVSKEDVLVKLPSRKGLPVLKYRGRDHFKPEAVPQGNGINLIRVKKDNGFKGYWIQQDAKLASPALKDYKAGFKEYKLGCRLPL